MLKSVFDAHDSIINAINSISETKKKYYEMLLATSELEIVENLVQLFYTFFQFTELMSDSKNVTISVVIPGVRRLLDFYSLIKANLFIEELSVNIHAERHE
jgi:hypothetical protein